MLLLCTVGQAACLPQTAAGNGVRESRVTLKERFHFKHIPSTAENESKNHVRVPAFHGLQRSAALAFFLSLLSNS